MFLNFKKIYFISFITIFLIILVACGKPHQHTFSEDYEYDEYLHWRECSECHQKVDYIYHTFTSWQVVVEATETTEGLRRQVCTVCGYERTQIIPITEHEHEYGPWEFEIVPTYTSVGKIVRKCEINEEHIETMELPILNPTYYRYQVVEEATCDHEGREKYSLVINGQTLEIEMPIPKTDHLYSDVWSSDSLGHWHESICEHSGLTTDYGEHIYYNGYCIVCNYKEPEEEHIHEYGEWLLDSTPTFDSLGQIKRICKTNEAHIEYQDLPVLNSNDYDYEIIIPSTCSKEGIAVYMITIDGQEFKFEVDLPLADHTYSTEWSVDNLYHWHDSTCEHLDLKIDYEEHIFENGRCIICGYVGYSEGLIYELNEDNASYSVVGLGSFHNQELVIPGEYQNLPVTKVSQSLFKDCSFIEKVRLGEGIEEIGDYCFQNCTQLKSIEFPTTLKKIGNYCFDSCSSLVNVILPEGFENIGGYAWNNCKALIQLEIPSSIVEVGLGFIDGCTSLNYNEYDNGLYLGNGESSYVLFVQANDPLIRTCEIHKDTKIIGPSAFKECMSITSIVIPENVISIGINCFYFCTRLDYIILSSNITSIGRAAFSGCNLRYIYYMGSNEEFSTIEIDSSNSINHLVYYYKETPSQQGEWTFDEHQNPIPFQSNGE